MPLLTYQQVRPYSRAIEEKVTTRQMPPWFADPAVGHFANDPRLTEREIATIAQWVDAGAPQGDPATRSRRCIRSRGRSGRFDSSPGNV